MEPRAEHSSTTLERWRDCKMPLLDLRPMEDYKKGHIAGSTWCSWEMLPARVSELPPKRNPVPILVSSAELTKPVLSFLLERDYPVPFTFVWTDTLAAEAAKLGILCCDTSVSKILWEPSPCLLGVIDTIEQMRSEAGIPPAGTALDIACGGGRDIVFLALRGWDAVGVDYQERQCEKVQELAQYNNVGNRVRVECLDVEKHMDSVLTHLAPADLVNVARYLNRDLMPHLRALVKPGGFIVFHQFMVGCTKPHRPKFLLREGELATEHFSEEHGFRILADRVVTISDGRPTSYFLAQKVV